MKTLLFLICIFILVPLLSGCFMLPEEEALLPPPAREIPDARVFPTTPVIRSDIILESTAFAQYRSAINMNHLFTIDDIPILGIFVSFGDIVSQGDIIAVLDAPEIRQEYEELVRSRSAVQLELNQLQQRHNILTRQAHEDGEAIDNTTFNNRRSVLQSEINHLTRLIEYVERIDEDRYLRAGMDGIVTSVTSFEDGMLSNSNQNIATVSDPNVSAFVVQGLWARDMSPGERYIMTLGEDDFEMVVLDPYETGFEISGALATAFLDFAGEPPPPGFPTQGSVHIEIGEARDVLVLPIRAVRQTTERTFVYVLEAEDLRTVRDLELGLEGDTQVEVISGLEEGELVIPWG